MVVFVIAHRSFHACTCEQAMSAFGTAASPIRLICLSSVFE
jgi:hypothetical protein